MVLQPTASDNSKSLTNCTKKGGVEAIQIWKCQRVQKESTLKDQHVFQREQLKGEEKVKRK